MFKKRKFPSHGLIRETVVTGNYDPNFIRVRFKRDVDKGRINGTIVSQLRWLTEPYIWRPLSSSRTMNRQLSRLSGREK